MGPEAGAETAAVKLVRPPPVNKRSGSAAATAANKGVAATEGRDRINQRRPRETRSISSLTSRSTSGGRLSSSHSFSIGRSISETRSSKVRAF